MERARWSVWDAEAVLTPRGYVDAVQRAGGMAVLLVPDPRAEQDPDELLDLVDGLILAGGADIDPSAYGAQPHPETSATNPDRDRFELALTARAVERDLPLLAVCRGMQLLNVARGGTLHQHLPETHGHHEHRREAGTFDGADHDVRLAPGSLAARAAGETTRATKSHHHQGVDRVGDGLEVTGWSVLDELPEAVELPDRRYVLGVQWHPEADEASQLIASLVREAEGRRAAAPGPGPAAAASSS
jgi:putative glutamine amidotransferase